MGILAASVMQVISITLAVIAVVAIATWLLNRQRHDVWSRIAKRYGLSYVAPPDGPRVTGQRQGRTIRIEFDDAGSDRDIGGVEVIRVSVGLHDVPPDMTAEGVPGLIGDLAMLTEVRIEFDASEFNRDVLVKAEDEQLTRAYWDDRRQLVFLQLIETAPCDQIMIRNNSLIAELREMVSDRNRLESLLDRLSDAAARLDG